MRLIACKRSETGSLPLNYSAAAVAAHVPNRNKKPPIVHLLLSYSNLFYFRNIFFMFSVVSVEIPISQFVIINYFILSHTSL